VFGDPIASMAPLIGSKGSVRSDDGLIKTINGAALMSVRRFGSCGGWAEAYRPIEIRLRDLPLAREIRPPEVLAT
jgi:hypothetical protein